MNFSTQTGSQGTIGTASTASPGPSFTIKLKEPPTFNGSVDSDVDTWLLTVDDFLRASNTQDETVGVNYIVMLLVGDAKNWWHSYLSDSRNARPATVRALKAALKKRFGSALREKRARTALRDMRIKTGESVRTYSARFTAELQKLPRYDSEWAMDQYVHGLPQRVAELVTIAGITELDEAVKKAEEIEMARTLTGGQTSSGGQGGKAKGFQANTSWRGRGNRGGNSGGRGSGGSTNFGNRGFRGSGFRGRFSSRGGGQNAGGGRCFICGDASHWSNRCPQRNQQRGRGGPQAARGRGRSVPSRTALHVTQGANASEEEMPDATTAAHVSRTQGN